jgi:hypothetical protein
MKDLEKIKEFFLKDRAMTAAYEAKEEYFKPLLRKDKSYPNFLYVDIAYPAGSGVLSIGGDKTMSGQDREAGAAKALTMGNAVAKKLQAKYNIEDIEVNDLKNGKVQVFAVSDDFIKMSTPSLDEAKKETGIDMAKKQLDALGVKYEMSKTDKVRPFKVIYQPINKSDEFYDKFEDIVDLFNLKGVVKTSMDEAKFMSGLLSGKDFINAKLSKYPKAVSKINQLIDMIGENKFTIEMAEWIFDFFNNASFESPVNEAKKEDAVDTITMDVPLFIRMLEYSREDAAEDMDLHDVTEKAISLGKERGILQMDDYDEIIGTTEKVNEVNLKQAKLSSAEYQKAKKLKDFKASDWKWNADEDLYTKVVKEGMGGQLDEPYFIEVSVRDARKALDLFQDQYRKSNIEMYGSNVYAANTPEDIYDLYYDLTSQDIEILDSSNFEEDLDEAKHKEKGIEKRISEALNKINEELCPAGKAYRKRRIAAGEKSSAYLSGRAVKVCKGQISGKKKKK